MKRYVVTLLMVLVAGSLSRNCFGSDATFCGRCEFAVGAGNTYHFWGETGGLVVTASGLFDQGRYEVSLFRMATTQTLHETGWNTARVMAEPYWGVSASRRWQLVSRADWRLIFGFGISYKTEEDALNSTHWNFASQLGIRVHDATPGKPGVEVWIRHWSNAGIRLPNRGQDFVTVSLVF